MVRTLVSLDGGFAPPAFPTSSLDHLDHLDPMAAATTVPPSNLQNGSRPQSPTPPNLNLLVSAISTFPHVRPSAHHGANQVNNGSTSQHHPPGPPPGPPLPAASATESAASLQSILVTNHKAPHMNGQQPPWNHHHASLPPPSHNGPAQPSMQVSRAALIPASRVMVIGHFI
jgi:hypothetical protein